MTQHTFEGFFLTCLPGQLTFPALLKQAVGAAVLGDRQRPANPCYGETSMVKVSTASRKVRKQKTRQPDSKTLKSKLDQARAEWDSEQIQAKRKAIALTRLYVQAMRQLRQPDSKEWRELMGAVNGAEQCADWLQDELPPDPCGLEALEAAYQPETLPTSTVRLH